MTDQPTRMIFAAKLAAGATIIDPCGKRCPNTTGIHDHQLAVLDVMPEGDFIRAIVVQEDGEQRGWSVTKATTVRIIAVA